MLYVLCPNWKAWGLLQKCGAKWHKEGTRWWSFKGWCNVVFNGWVCILPELAARRVIRGTNCAFHKKEAFMRAGAAATCFLTTSHSHKRWPVRRKSEPRAPHWQRVREVHRFKRSLVAPHEEESNTLHNGAIFIQGDRLQSASRWKWKRSISSSASWASMMLTMMAAWVTIAAFSVAEPLHASGELKRKVHRPRQTLIRQPNPPPSQHRSTKLNAVIQSVQNTLACLSMAPRPPRPPLTG